MLVDLGGFDLLYADMVTRLRAKIQWLQCTQLLLLVVRAILAQQRELHVAPADTPRIIKALFPSMI